MKLNIHLFCVLAACHARFREELDTTFLFHKKRGAPTVFAVDLLRGPCDHLTSVINAIRLQSQTEGGFDGRFIAYSSSPPTPACMGVAKRCNIDTVYFPMEDPPERDRPVRKWRTAQFATEPHVDYLAGEDRLEEFDVPDAPVSLSEMIHALRGGGSPRVFAWWSQVYEQVVGDVDDERADALSLLRWKTLIDAPSRVAIPVPAGVPVECNAVRSPDLDQYRDAVFMSLAQGIVALRRQRVRDIDPTHHEIGCVLVGPGGHILSWGVNTITERDKSRHAEVNCDWNKVKDSKHGAPEVPKAPVDRYRTPSGLRAFQAALDLLAPKGRLEALITREAAQFGGLAPSKAALVQARALLGFLGGLRGDQW